MKIPVEEALRRAEHRTAFVRYAADTAASNSEVPTPEALSGMADVLDEVETLVRSVRKALDADALGVELRLRDQS